MTRLWKLWLLCLFICFVSKANAQLQANFDASIKTGCAPVLINFKDISTGNPNYWKWDLGNGTISFIQNPSVTYFNAGNYTIKLLVRNSNGNADSVVKQQYVTINAAPLVKFNATDTGGCYPLNVQFTDVSDAGTGSLTSWLWDFGDGNTANIQNPAHTYNSAGNYNVSLRVTNSNGCITTLSKSNYIKLLNGVDADFSFKAPNSCKPPTVITFTNSSTGTGVLNYVWSFGDGATSTQQNPSHTYAAPGVYTVKLVVQNSVGCIDSLVQQNAITIGTVNANFIAPADVCRSVNFSITNLSSPAPISANWDFGDGTTSTQINPVKKYTTSGTYTIKLESDFGACKDVVAKSILVKPGAIADFSGTNLSSCKPPLTSSFTNTSQSYSSVKWFFGDGDSSTANNPTHTYLNFGNFTVTLIAFSANGCTDTLVKKGFVQIAKPDVTINNLPKEGCAPLFFAPVVASSSTLTAWLWDFGDGTTSTLQKPSHTYTSTGTYTVKLTYQTGDCIDSVIYPNSIKVGDKPVVNFTALPNIACAFTAVQFNNLTTPATATSYFWQFGDGGTSNTKNPVYNYQDTGHFTVTLIVTNNGCKDSLVIKDYVTIKPPVAKFKDSLICASPLQRFFIDKSIGATSWFWDFGDGTTSSAQNPVHQFPDSGSYTVKLTVKNDTCENTANMVVNIISQKANFAASDTVICKGTVLQFKTIGIDVSKIRVFKWDFGDGVAVNSTATINYRYTKAGLYDVQLIVVDLNGCTDTLLKKAYIRVDGPTAAFIAGNNTACENSTIIFSDASVSDGIHALTSWVWNYGDGVIDSLSAAPFQHTYKNFGAYNVTLKVYDAKGCSDSLKRNAFVIVSKPKAAFSSPDTVSCPQKNIRFINTSTGATPVLYTWNFGDNATASITQPIHTYLNEGLYDIKLIVKDKYGCADSINRPAYINIKKPKPSFTVNDSVATCPPLVVDFTNTSQNFISYEWDFGDNTKSTLNNPTHFYNVPGTYMSKLVITSPGGCKDSVFRKIVVRGPQGSFSYNAVAGCAPINMNFKASTKDDISFIWDYNDGSTDATTSDAVSHTYMLPGNYVPKMILVDPQGCKVAIPGPDTIKVHTVKADFSLNTKTLCDSGLVNFSNSTVSNDDITAYKWSFGDGATSTQKNPQHFYTTNGNYKVQLIAVTALGCTDTLSMPAPVKIVPSPMIGVTGNAAACEPATLQFTSQLLRPDTAALSWKWNFGNGVTSALPQPQPVLYQNAGNYSLTVTATNSSSCSDTVFQQILIHPIPNIDAGKDAVICKGETYQLTASGAALYNWQPAQYLSCNNCASPLASIDSNRIFFVRGANSFGCTATDSIFIKVQQPFSLSVSNGDTLCVGEKTTLLASGADLYNWSPSSGLNNAGIANPVASPIQTTTYKVVGKDMNNCFSDTDFVQIVVYNIPTVYAGQDKTIAVSDKVQLAATTSQDVTAILWKPSVGLDCINCINPVANPTQTTTYTITVSNLGNCIAKDAVTLFVVCNQGNFFVPNTFSPNNDGSNDVFYVRGKGLNDIKSFKIFNRWGELVFEKQHIAANDPGGGWDGRFKGVIANADVYVYLVEVVCENSAVMIYKGDVTLIR